MTIGDYHEHEAALDRAARLLAEHRFASAARRLAVEIHAGHIYDVPWSVGFVFKHTPDGGTLTAFGDDPVNATATLERAAQMRPALAMECAALAAWAWSGRIDKAQDALDALAAPKVAQDCGAEWVEGETVRAKAVLESARLAFKAAYAKIGEGWATLAMDVIEDTGAVERIPF